MYAMNKIMMASIAVLVLVIGVGTNSFYHAAEAKGMPKCWLNTDGTIKHQYLGYLKAAHPDTYPIPIQKAFCDKQARNFV